MSLSIDIATVKAVLINGDWHKAMEKSFDLDAYEFMHGKDMIHGWEQRRLRDRIQVPWTNRSDVLWPLTAIQAVSDRPPSIDPSDSE